MADAQLQLHIPAYLADVCARLRACGAPVYLVGGVVRDALLGMDASLVTDVDVCGPLPPDALACAAAPLAGVTLKPRNSALGTVELHVQDARGARHMLEYTTYRTDSYRGGAHRPDAVAFVDTPEADALRRDFTCNALYYAPDTGELRDPLGGLSDIRQRVLRTTRAPDAVFGEDGLRTLRLARFAARLRFSIDQASWRGACAHVHLLADIAPERIQSELNAMLLCDARYPQFAQAGEASCVLVALRLLHDMGALAYIIPELLEGDNLDQNCVWHAYPVMEHLFHTCTCADPTLVMRLAGLLHDIGKPRALREHGRMLGHDAIGAEMARAILTRLRYPKDVIARVCAIVANHMYDLDGKAKPKTMRRRFLALGPQQVEDLIAIRRADVLGSGIETQEPAVCGKWRRTLHEMQARRTPFAPSDLALSGQDVMRLAHLAPGPAVGEAMQYLLRSVVHCPEKNTPAHLARLLAAWPGPKNG
nr:HD domain-containing protein [Maliibacterium massiliense]